MIRAPITASYPNEARSGWRASSKDHAIRDPHILKVYAIGIKIQGMTRDALLTNMLYQRYESGRQSHPISPASLEPGYVLVGGGFNVNWLNPNAGTYDRRGEGNYATASYPPNTFTWEARSQDHLRRDSPSTITTLAIGIKRNLPVGNVQGVIDIALSSIASHPSSTALHPSSTVNIRPNFALVGGGAFVHQSHRMRGSLLWKLAPATHSGEQSFTAASKDHEEADPTNLTAYALGIRVLPYPDIEPGPPRK